MVYAIIEDSGTQIKVAQGDVLDIDPREGADGGTLTFDRVLAVGDGDGTKPATLGRPYVDGASVTAEVLETIRDRKVDVIKFKRRKGYRRKRGHRQPYLRVQIKDIKG